FSNFPSMNRINIKPILNYEFFNEKGFFNRSHRSLRDQNHWIWSVEFINLDNIQYINNDNNNNNIQSNQNTNDEIIDISSNDSDIEKDIDMDNNNNNNDNNNKNTFLSVKNKFKSFTNNF